MAPIVCDGASHLMGVQGISNQVMKVDTFIISREECFVLHFREFTSKKCSCIFFQIWQFCQNSKMILEGLEGSGQSEGGGDRATHLTPYHHLFNLNIYHLTYAAFK